MGLANLEPVIMVVDDDPDVLEILRLKIKMLLPLEVVTEDSALSALETLKTRDIPLVITDINMPQMNGVQLLESVKALEKGIQVIVMSAGTSTINCIDCLRHGAADFLVKPFENDVLLAVLRSNLERFERWSQFFGSRWGDFNSGKKGP